MTDHDKSLFDRAKDALGMGDDREHHDEHRPDDDNVEHRDTGGLGVDGATQAAGSSGAAGGMGASGGMGGAGAITPADATPEPSEETPEPTAGNRERTEYEMGREFDPEHEKVAESGLFAERAGEAEVDTWGSGDTDQRSPE